LLLAVAAAGIDLLEPLPLDLLGRQLGDVLGRARGDGHAARREVIGNRVVPEAGSDEVVAG